MPLLRAVPVMLSAGERKTLNKRVRGAKTAHRDRLRAQIVLSAACGRDNARIARDLGISQDTARKWRGRFAGRGLDGLADLPRPGRPRRISELTRAAVVALACQLPAATGVPLSRWTGPELLAEITKAGLGRQLSVSSVLRILAEHPVKPWQYQSWISPRDPDFAARASVILDLYQGFHQGKRLRPGDRILSVDAKPSIQARGRCRPTTPARPGKPMRVEHEYVRHGCAARIIDCAADLCVRQRPRRRDGWLAACCSRSSTCWFAGYSAWLCCYSAGTWRRMLSCWCCGTKTRSCACTSARSGTSQQTGCGSPRWHGCSRAGAGPKSSPSRPRRCWPGTAGWPRASMIRAIVASPAARRRSLASPALSFAWRRRIRSGDTAGSTVNWPSSA